MKTTGHHTCRKDDESVKEKVLEEAPFLSEWIDAEDPNQRKLPFLGTGYYYWDYNLSMAKNWGKTHYKGKFYVIESRLHLPGNVFLDLVGRRQDIEIFLGIIDWVKEKGFDRRNWGIGACIDFLRKMSKFSPDLFKYKAIRAIDHGAGKPLKHMFVQGKQGFINLNPRILICLYDKEALMLRSKSIVYES